MLKDCDLNLKRPKILRCLVLRTIVQPAWLLAAFERCSDAQPRVVIIILPLIGF